MIDRTNKSLIILFSIAPTVFDKNLLTILEQADVQVKMFNDGTAVREYFIDQTADIFIVCSDVPFKYGHELIKTLRTRERTRMPIICVSESRQHADLVALLDAGADDYLPPTLSNEMLLAKMRVWIRRSTLHQPTSFAVGKSLLNQASQTISIDDINIKLGHKEFHIAWNLAIHQGKAISRQDLFRAAWGIDVRMATRSVDMYVSRLRKHLARFSCIDWDIQSIYGRGYRLNLKSAEQQKEQT